MLRGLGVQDHAVGGVVRQHVGQSCRVVGGGGQLRHAEHRAAVEEGADLVYVLMNDAAYGVIQNIQDAQYGGRRHYSQLKTPNFAKLCDAIDIPHMRVDAIEAFPDAFDAAMKVAGPVVLEVDMVAIGPFAEAFGGPPAGAAGKAS